MPISVAVAGEDALPALEDMSFSAGVNGGFATCTLSVKGDLRPPKLSKVSAAFEGIVVWEGLITDLSYSYADGEISTSITCAGFQRLLDWAQVIVPYSIRNLNWEKPGVSDAAAFMSGAATFNYQPTAESQIAVGQYDSTSTSKKGLRFSGDSTVMAANDGVGVHFTLPSALTEAGALKATITCSGAGVGSGAAQMSLRAACSSDGSTWTGVQVTASGSLSLTLPVNTKYVRVGWVAGATGLTPAGTDIIEVTSIRLLGTAVGEDDTSTANQEGMWPTTLVGDLMGRQAVIGLNVETITDFVVTPFGSFQYQSLRDHLDTLFSFCPGYWGVYDGPTLVFRRSGRAAAIQANDCVSYTVRDSVELETQQVTVSYTDIVTGQPASASATVLSSSFAGTPYGKRDVYSSGQLAGNMASTLAGQIATARSRPVVAASVTVPGSLPCEVGPCLHLRPGDRVGLVGVRGLADNLFDIIESSYSMRSDELTLTLGYYNPSIDVLLARIASIQQAAV